MEESISAVKLPKLSQKEIKQGVIIKSPIMFDQNLSNKLLIQQSQSAIRYQNEQESFVANQSYSQLVHSFPSPKSFINLSRKVREHKNKSIQIQQNKHLFIKSLPQQMLKIQSNSKQFQNPALSDIEMTLGKEVTFDQIQSNYRMYLQKFLKSSEKDKIMKQDFNFDNIQFNHNPNNMQQIEKLLSFYIQNNRKFLNSDVVHIPEYEKQAMLDINSLKFADRFLPQNLQVQKVYGFDEENLARNKLTLEKVVLERLILKQQTMKKDQNILHIFNVPNLKRD